MLVTVTLANHNGLTHDEVMNSYAFTGPGTFGSDYPTRRDAVVALYNAIGHDLAASVDHSAVTFRTYDILGHLDGTPHGSPIDVLVTNITASAANTPLPSGVALCVSLHGVGYATAAVEGPAEQIPTQDFAQDQGAPATHLGNTRPKKRHEGRVYLGPFDATMSAGMPFEATPDPAKVAAWRAAVAALIGFGFCVWSRRDGTLYPVVECATRGVWSYQRLRQPRPTAVLHTP